MPSKRWQPQPHPPARRPAAATRRSRGAAAPAWYVAALRLLLTFAALIVGARYLFRGANRSTLSLVQPQSALRDAVAAAAVARVSPRLGQHAGQFRRALIVCAALSGVAYFAWRLLYSLDSDNLVLSIGVFLVELLLFANAAMFWWVTWSDVHAAPFLLEPGHTVDVFITTYNEDTDLVRATALGAMAMDYPHRTYILDDGRRETMRLMAEEIGSGYLTRPDNAGAKAGNINHALKQTGGEFVAIFDADHVPQRAFLVETLGYFVAPRMAIVQTPQDYYNLSSIQHDHDQRRAPADQWHEQRIFFDVVMPAKNRTNSAFWCGSCAVLRRAAIEAIGGMSTDCVIEDMLSSQQMHAAGWVTYYLPASLAYGLAPDDAAQFYTQRLRWAQGAMQILRSPHSPLRMPGLTLAQRISYFSSVATYFDAHLRLLLMLLPIWVFFTGQAPLHATPLGYVSVAVPYMFSSMLLSVITHGGVRNLVRQERFTIAKMLVSIRASFTLITGSRTLGFAVTPKTGDGGGSPDARILGFLEVLYAAAAVMGVVGYFGYGPSAGLDPWLAAGSGVWLVINAALTATAIPLLQGRTLHRKMYRFPWRVPVAYINQRTGEQHVGGTLDVSWEGIGLVGDADPGDLLDLAIRPTGSATIRLTGEVRSTNPATRRLGVLLARSDRKELDRLMLSAMLAAPHGQDRASTTRWGDVERSLVAS